MAIPRFLRPVISWFSHHISRGLTAIGLLGRAQDRFPGIEESRLREAGSLAEQAVQVAARANRLSASDPLSAALAGDEPPDSDVEVRVLSRIVGPAGDVHTVSLRVPMAWQDTFGQLLDITESALRAYLQRYPGRRIASVDVIPPMLLGR